MNTLKLVKALILQIEINMVCAIDLFVGITSSPTLGHRRIPPDNKTLTRISHNRPCVAGKSIHTQPAHNSNSQRPTPSSSAHRHVDQAPGAHNHPPFFTITTTAPANFKFSTTMRPRSPVNKTPERASPRCLQSSSIPDYCSQARCARRNQLPRLMRPAEQGESVPRGSLGSA